MKHSVRKTVAKIPKWKYQLFRGLVVLFLLLAAADAYLLFFHKPQHPPAEAAAGDINARLRDSIYDVLFDFNISVDWISGNNRFKTVRIPADLPMVEPYTALAERFQQLGGKLLKATSNPSGTEMSLEVGDGQKALFRLRLLRDPSLHRVGGKIALVIDDFGYSLSNSVREFLTLPQPVTVSILPGLTYSKKIARLAHDNGLEVLVHLPMQPQSGDYRKDDYIILKGMNAAEIRRRVRRSIQAIPFATGLNNHKGSLATTDSKIMNAVLDELKKRKYYFLDSRTSDKSVAYALARKKKLPCLFNNTFLDAIQEEPFVRQQLNLLAEMATKNGFAVGIGHPHEVTLAVLKEACPMLEKRGFQFVSLSELIKKER